MNIFYATLKVLKFPLKLLVSLIGNKKKRPQKSELEEKQWKHVRNFAPTHYSWQKSIGKRKKKPKTKKIKKGRKFLLNPTIQMFSFNILERVFRLP